VLAGGGERIGSSGSLRTALNSTEPLGTAVNVSAWPAAPCVRAGQRRGGRSL